MEEKHAETKIIGNAIYKNGYLWLGYDYKNQCWVEDGLVRSCGHPEIMDCRCYGRKHAGEKTTCTEKEVIEKCHYTPTVLKPRE